MIGKNMENNNTPVDRQIQFSDTKFTFLGARNPLSL
jgi:hypothetical protein